MNRDVILVHVQIPHLIQRQAHQLAGKLQVQAPGVAAVLFPGTVENSKELFAADRLHQVVEGGHIIALGNVIGVAGDEHDLHGFILLPHRFGQRHTVRARHFHVQK